MKKITSILLSLVLCFSMSANVFASEISTEQEPVSVITVADENGKDVEYELYNNSITNIPIYAAKEGDTSRALTEVATLTIGIGDGFAAFTFTPSNVGIALLTVGFTGDFTTYLSGIKYGYNSYIIPVLSGTVSASSKGTGCSLLQSFLSFTKAVNKFISFKDKLYVFLYFSGLDRNSSSSLVFSSR